jgi:hypothetical protein
VRTIFLGAILGVSLASSKASAAPSVWVVDDGEKIRRDAIDTQFEHGQENPVWRPGEPVRLFAMKNESVAMQVVVEADDVQLRDVSVDLQVLDGPDGAWLGAAGVSSQVARPVERFVEHFGAGKLPDALIPVEHTPSWAPYPLVVDPRSNGIVWIDVNVPRDQRAGTYRGAVHVHSGNIEIGTLPVELDVADAMLPDRTVAATGGYDHDLLERRAGSRAEQQLWMMLHAHRIAPMHDAVKPEDVTRQNEALDGSLYLRSRSYLGPAPGLGDGVLAIGARGAFGGPDDPTLARVQAVAAAASAAHAFAGGDVFLYVSDEQCSSPWGGGWQKLLRESPGEGLRHVRVAWTCTQDPTAQPVDVPVLGASWDPERVRAARDQGKTVWVYGGELPRTGSFAIGADAVSPRVNGWLQAMFGIPRWLVLDLAHWSDEAGDATIGEFNLGADGRDGADMLVYPGTQLDPYVAGPTGAPAVLPSIRLKNWRRGIEDAGYLQMARERDPVRADAVARWLLPTAFGEVHGTQEPSWSARGKTFFEARRALLAIALGQKPLALEPRAAARVEAQASSSGCTRGAGETGGGVALALVAGTALTSRSRRRRARAASN